MVALAAGPGRGHPQAPRLDGAALYESQIRPALEANCLKCHSAEMHASDLDLSTREGLLKGGIRGPAIVAGNSAASLLHRLVAHLEKPHMPPMRDRLPDELVGHFAAWIDTGAPYGPAAPAPGAAPTANATGLFATAVRPVLEGTCLKCHDHLRAASGLDVTTRESLLHGGDRGPAVVPGNAKASLLYKAITHAGEIRMPFKADKLPEPTIARIAEWIDQGARYDAPLAAAPAGKHAPAVDHWAFKAPKRPAVPAVRDRAWVRNPVDAFVAAEREKRGLRPAPPADKRTLLRRVYLDVTGLPPTPEEVAAFLADRSEEAYERVVDRLLRSPRYGEQWGRHWMDIWRYSDWYGIRYANLVRYSERHVWRWRDWIVDSLNQDKTYDRMILEMLAGDEVAPDDPAVLRATGYLVRNRNSENRNVGLQETVDHTAAGFLGITLKCARCHDHKFDPFLQTEYYRFRAFFEPMAVRIDRVAGQPDTIEDGLARIFDAKADAPTYRFIRGDSANPDKNKPLEPGVPAVLGNGALQVHPVELSVRAYYPDSRTVVQDDLVGRKRTEVAKAEAALAKARARLRELGAEAGTGAGTSSGAHTGGASEHGDLRSTAGKPDRAELESAATAVAIAGKNLEATRAELPALEARVAADRARFAAKADPKAEDLAVAAREAERPALLARAEAEIARASEKIDAAKKLIPGDLPKAEAAVEQATARLQAALEAVKYRAEYTPVGTIHPTASTGRRTALARWIGDTKNPLTARVAVNHIWLRHFGQALVPSTYDFGLKGKPPSHPELLDWLSVEFMERGWSMKAMHRLLLTSNTYRMSSAATAADAGARTDPENVYLWRMNSRRMQAENVRDSVLAVSGRLDATMGGPELDEAEGQTIFRRSLYFRHTPEDEMVFLKVFDAANPNECYRRNESVVPQQALALANSDLSWTESRVVARRLSQDAAGRPDAAPFVDAAFERVLGRPPTAAEREESARFVREQAALLEEPKKLTPFRPAGGGPAGAPVPAKWERGKGIVQKGGKTVTDVYPRWTKDALAGKCVTIEKQTHRIESNTGIVLNIKGSWKLETGDEYPYQIAECSAEFVAEEARAEAARGNSPSADPDLRAREGLIHALFNHNEFVTIR